MVHEPLLLTQPWLLVYKGKNGSFSWLGQTGNRVAFCCNFLVVQNSVFSDSYVFRLSLESYRLQRGLVINYYFHAVAIVAYWQHRSFWLAGRTSHLARHTLAYHVRTLLFDAYLRFNSIQPIHFTWCIPVTGVTATLRAFSSWDRWCLKTRAPERRSTSTSFTNAYLTVSRFRYQLQSSTLQNI